ncbi:tannase/feruloyl esterase family alpha/beta hydrolase [Actinomadura sp. SCN-SB]|uniref:tannase/feruloyl esterase family alpha/beta hydrolase n=1 Tax=Actinomadura sp. SCN-SB TaxID=3373092 RepID=UPI0037511EAC
MRWAVRLTASLAVLAGALAAPASSSAANRPACDVNDLQATVPADTTIVSAKPVAEPTAHCRVDGHVTTRNPGPNQVNFMVALPRDHNGRYFFIGLGGTAGYVPNPPANLLADGYAIAGTDTGNQTGDTAGQTAGLDWSFMGDPAKALDHDHRGAHVTAVATQRLTKAYYGIGTLFRYHSGCSGGGRMGVNAAQVYPEDYDGIIVGAAGRDLGNMLHFGKVAQYLQRNPGGVIPSAKLQTIAAQILRDWDAADRAVDGMVWDPSVVKYSRAQLDDLLADLTPAQRTTIKLIREGYDIGGAARVADYPLSGIQHWDVWMGPFPHTVFNTWAHAAFGADFNYVTDYDFTSLDDERAFLAPFAGLQFGSTRTGAEFTRFRDAGGKLLTWHGVHDPVISYNGAPQTYEELVKASGGQRKAQTWARLFAVPGISHCGGGDGPQDTPDRALDALANWVENGVAPDSIVAERPSDGRSFRLCPHPQAAVFRGGVQNPHGLDPDSASNWLCKGRSHA